LKPLAWQGDLSFGPAVGGEVTFQRLDRNPRWAGVPDLEDAGPRAVEAYLRAYGPTTPEHVHRWLGNGLGAGRKRIRSWIAGLADRIEEVEIEGDRVFLLAEDLDDLTAARTSHAVRLLPGYDQWVLGPGTDDPRVVPPRRRSLLSRQANIVVTGGVVTGTWTRRDDQVTVSWFSESPKPDRKALSEEVDRIGAILGRPLHLVRGSGALDLGEVR
jgi:hypothetical protein